MAVASANETFAALVKQIGDGVPNSEQYQLMSSLILDFPEAKKLARLDPFTPRYKATTLELYLALRGRAEEGYIASRDEAPVGDLPENLWTGLVPWSFRDTSMVAEHLLAWGHIFTHLKIPIGGSVLEYGPGSGQLLLMLSRMGYRAFGVDIDPIALQGIRAQSAHLGLSVETERAEFGLGFEGKTFDCILFYEAFHHAFDFENLLGNLHHRLNVDGRIILCGEPIVQGVTDGIPYPWGPRLDALSVFCMRRFGWMELGFTHEFLLKVARQTGWTATFHPFQNCGRAAIYVLEAREKAGGGRSLKTVPDLQRELADCRQMLAAMHASTSWKLTKPLRASKGTFDNIKQVLPQLIRNLGRGSGVQ